MKCIDCFNLKATLPIGDKGEFQWYSAKAQCNKKHFAFVSVARANGRFHEHQKRWKRDNCPDFQSMEG